MTAHETIFQWLKDAHSMETSIEKVLNEHLKDAAGYPEMERRLRKHVQETQGHSHTLKLCLETNGHKPAGGKSLLGGLLGKIESMATATADDELVKNCLADYATEQFEIACYTSLIAAAEKAQLPDVAAVCRGILAEEEEMADWLSRQIPLVTEAYLDQKEARQNAEDQPDRRAAGG